MSRNTLLILIASILLTPLAPAGTYSGGTGDPNTPYLIAEPNDIIEMSNTSDDWDKHFLMIADVNMIDYTFTTAVIASDTSTDDGFQGITFSGFFDGDGNKISNLTIDTAGVGNDYLGLFGQIGGEQAEVKNLIIANELIKGYGSFCGGGLCGCNDGGTITKCYISCTTTGVSHTVGGLCGHNRFGIITDCSCTSITTGSGSVGGLCGNNYEGTISNCYTITTVIGFQHVGGLCGFNSGGSIINCDVAGEIFGDYYAGGLCGYNNVGTISNCYTSGFVISKEMAARGGVGGLCGINDSGTINGCISSSSVTGDSPYHSSIGGLCGVNVNGIIKNCCATGPVAGYIGVGGLCGCNTLGTISSSYATGPVTSFDDSLHIGGLCGANFSGNISNSYAASSVTGGASSENLGGLCGQNGGGIISNCYSIGQVSSGDDSEFLAGLCGHQEGNNSEITNSFWDIDTSELSIGYNLDPTYPGTVTNVLGKTTIEMKTQSTFTDYGWDFVGEDVNGSDDIWRMCADGVHYPHLWWQYSTLGDFDCPDGVDIEDILVLAGHWLEEEFEPLQSPDATGDGKVNLDDFAITSRNYLTQ